MKNSYITVTDQFCGAGGSSHGVRSYANKVGGGIEVKLALNHWKLAIETHNTNFPDTLHDCTDISACDPRRYPSTDILITSPECTNHSVSNGKKKPGKQMDMFVNNPLDPAEERSRATMWDVPRFAEYHNYTIIIVENVVDARRWIMFDAWLLAMHSLGYAHKCVYLNSRHALPTPQSRDRMYVVFWKKGNKAPNLDITPRANCAKCGKDVDSVQTWKNKRIQFGKYQKQYVYCCPYCSTIVEPYYYAAFNCIDWSDMGTRIGDRKKPLSPKSVRRINHGLNRYGHSPYLIDDKQTTGIGFRVRSVADPLNTVHGDPRVKLVLPFIIKAEHSSQMNVRSTANALQTQTTRQSQAVVIPPFIVESKGTSNSRSITEPLSCATSVGYHGILTDASWNSFIAQYYGGSHCINHITETIGTISTKLRSALVSYQTPSIEDCYYRMLKAKEIQLAMAFDKDYVVLGSAKYQVKQLGNAVTPPAMEMIIERCIETLK